MFGDIAHFLLSTIFTLLGAALLMRAWLYTVRIPPYNPISNGILQATNWLVLPLRHVFNTSRSVDWASLVATLLSAIVYVALMMAVAGAGPFVNVPMIAIVALLIVIKWALYLIVWLTILMAMLSWLNPHSPAMALLYQLTAPFLNPLRRVIPRLGGLDLSPILLFVIVQVLLMIVTRVAVSLTLFSI